MSSDSPSSSGLTRRRLLAGAGAAAAAASVPSPAKAAWFDRRRVRTTREDRRVVVIGSGFGGGVSAARLTQAGVPVTLLERGRRWATGPNANTFPTLQTLDKRVLWHESAPEFMGQPFFVDKYVGLLESVPGKNLTVVVPAGLGGGSLVYQGMSLQPTEAVFNEWFPNELDWQLMNRVHYPRAGRMLGLETAPDELITSKTYNAARVFARNAQRAGYNVQKVPMPIDWSWALRELKGEMRPSYTDGSGAFGINNGGKHSVDVTYIKAAEDTGKLDLRLQHNVTAVNRLADGRWEVHANRTDSRGTTREKVIIRTGALIMSAGTMNTTKLLMQAQGSGGIPDLPDGLGTGFGTNGDLIQVWTSFSDDFGVKQGGPVVYYSPDWDDPRTANTLIQAYLPLGNMNLRSTMMVGYGVSEGRGHWEYHKGGQVRLQWPKHGDDEVWRTINRRANRIKGPNSSNFLTSTNALVNTTWHPLGGAAMHSVCDLDGRVQGQRGLYVLDGALIPGTTAACNPSLTIAAVAERAMDNIVANDVGSTI